MSPKVYLPMAILLGLIAVPAVAQPAYPPTNPPPDRDRAMMNPDARMHHDWSDRDRRGMHGRGPDWRTIRWCRSMPYRRMMRIPRCRWLVRGHGDRMHHM